MLSQLVSGACDVSQLPADKLVQSITNVAVEFTLWLSNNTVLLRVLGLPQ
jgi:hypothetical protein